jgi:hypothetical protein
VEQDQPPHQSLHLLKLPPCLDNLPKPPSKRRRVNKRGLYISTSQARDHPTMSTESDMKVSGIPLTPLSYVISGVPSNPLSSAVWMPKAPSSSATQPVSFARTMGTNPFVFLYGMQNHDSQSIPSALLSPSLGITKEIMSRGPQVMDMEYQEIDELSMAMEGPSFLQCSPLITNNSIHPTSLVLK